MASVLSLSAQQAVSGVAWRPASSKWVLLGGKCGQCGALSYPMAVVCASCLSDRVSSTDLPTEGTLYTYTVVHQAPLGFETPYTLGYVDLHPQLRVLGHIDAAQADVRFDAELVLSGKKSGRLVGTESVEAPVFTLKGAE